MPSLEPRLLLGPAAQLLGVEPSVLKHWSRKGWVRYTRIGHSWLYAPEDLDSFLQAHTVDRRVGAADPGR